MFAGRQTGGSRPDGVEPAAMLRTTWAPVASVYRTVGFTDNESPPAPPPTVPRRLRNLGLGLLRAQLDVGESGSAVTATGATDEANEPKPAGRCVPTQPGQTQIRATRGRQ